MPIEVMAERGVETLRFGPMKPVGLDDPRTGRWPYASSSCARTMRSARCGTWSASRPS
jgi:folate-dependent tRNA-U54 methylase TrmFO/GidA